jgi:hypothetical protein
MSVNEYITMFTQLSHYAPHEVDTDEKKQKCFLNGLNDGLAYALEARDFENFHEMVKKAHMLENCRGVMERKHKMVHQHQSGRSSRPRVAMSSIGPMFHPSQLQFQPRPQAAGQGFFTPQHQVIPCPTISRLLLLRIRVFRGPKLPKTRCKLIVGATTMETRDITPNDAPIRAPVPIRLLLLHLPPLVEPTLFLLLPSRTMLMGESTMLL